VGTAASWLRAVRHFLASLRHGTPPVQEVSSRHLTFAHVPSSVIGSKQGHHQEQGRFLIKLSYHLSTRCTTHRRTSFRYGATPRNIHGQIGNVSETRPLTRQGSRSSSKPPMPPLNAILVHRPSQARTAMTVDAVNAIVTPARIHKIRTLVLLRKSRSSWTRHWNVPVTSGASGTPCACVEYMYCQREGPRMLGGWTGT